MKIQVNKEILKKLTAGALSLAIAATPLTASAATFSDIPNNAWYKSTVDYAVSIGAIDGYEDKTFRPNNKMTYAEFIKMSIKPLMPKDYESNGFGEGMHWAMKSYEFGVEKGILKDEDGFVGMLDKAISREDMIKILVNVYQYSNEDIIIKQGIENNIPDLYYATKEAQEQIKAAYSAGLIAGKGTGVEPESETIRAEAATVAARITNENYRVNVAVNTPKEMTEAQVKLEADQLIKNIEFDLNYVKNNISSLTVVYNNCISVEKEIKLISTEMNTILNNAKSEVDSRRYESDKKKLQKHIDSMLNKKENVDRIDRFIAKTKVMIENVKFDQRNKEISNQLVQEKTKKFTKQTDLNELKSLSTKSQTLKMDFVKSCCNGYYLKNMSKKIFGNLSDLIIIFKKDNDAFTKDNNQIKDNERPSYDGGSRNNANPPQQSTGGSDGNGQTDDGGFTQDSDNPPAKDQNPDGGDRVEISCIDNKEVTGNKILVLTNKNNIYTSNINC